MSRPVIRVEHLSKKYLVGHESARVYGTLRGALTETARDLSRRLLHRRSDADKTPRKEEFWALRDVSFEVGQGDRLGVIGRNGAGKSTLLKILSRITEATEGRVSLRGRVASLLEVGTGFHPELSGRENIFLNGAVLGMSRAEIRKKFDEIVAFAEIDKFLDTPVKRYSSGMHVRLAFAVAAHLEPEILVVDEVLAVGDAQFQKKCLGKMKEVSRTEGRTVLFVSHQMNAVEQLCTSALLLDEGRIQVRGEDVRAIIKRHVIGTPDERYPSQWRDTPPASQNPWFEPTRFGLVDRNGAPLSLPVRNDGEIYVRIEAEIKRLDPALNIGYAIYSESGNLLYWSYHTDTTQEQWPRLRIGHCVLVSRLPSRLLNEGSYRLELIGGLHFRQWLFEPGKAVPTIHLDILGGLSDSPYWIMKRPGLIAPVIRWTDGGAR